MTYSLELRPVARRDIESAHRWYEDRRQGLGLEFETCVEQAFTRILSDPESYDLAYRDLRRVPVNRFPYQVYFVVRQSRVIIVGVLHGRRSTSLIRRRSRRG